MRMATGHTNGHKMNTQTMLRQAVLSELWQTYILEFGDTHLDELLEECDRLTKSNISLAITAGAQEVKHSFLTKVVSTNQILYLVCHHSHIEPPYYCLEFQCCFCTSTISFFSILFTLSAFFFGFCTLQFLSSTKKLPKWLSSYEQFPL